jgi:hypothetical protein
MRKIPLRLIAKVVAAYLAMTIILFFIFVFPQNRKIDRIKARLATDPGIPAAEKTKEIVTLRNALAKAAVAVSGPPAGEKAVLERLSGLAGQTGTRVISVRPLGEDLYKVVFAGSYSQTLKFVNLLESDRTLFQIERLNMENNADTQQGELEARAYTDKAPAGNEAGTEQFWAETAELLKKFAMFKISPPPQAQRELRRPAFLSAVLFDDEKSAALFNGKIYHVGDSVDGGKIIAIKRNQVIIQNGAERESISLGSVYTKGAGQ